MKMDQIQGTVMIFVWKKTHLSAASIITIDAVTVKMCMMLTLLSQIFIKCVLVNEYILTPTHPHFSFVCLFVFLAELHIES